MDAECVQGLAVSVVSFHVRHVGSPHQPICPELLDQLDKSGLQFTIGKIEYVAERDVKERLEPTFARSRNRHTG